MARPTLFNSEEAQTHWEALCAQWQAGEKTADEIADLVGCSRRTVYNKLQQAQQRMECRTLDENQARHEESIRAAQSVVAESPPAPRHSGPDIDDGTYLTLVSSPVEAVRPVRDYSRDRIHGEPGYAVRPFYDLETTACSVDVPGTRVLVGGGAIHYDSSGAGRLRLPSPPLAGQRLSVHKVGQAKKSAEEPLRQYKGDNDGLEGGTGGAVAPDVPPGQHLWSVSLPDGREVAVPAKNRTGAKRAAKSLLKWESAKPLPAGTRVKCVG